MNFEIRFEELLYNHQLYDIYFITNKMFREMAHFIITRNNGSSYVLECDLLYAQRALEEEGSGSKLSMLHPGTSGHGTAGIDYWCKWDS